MARDLKHFLICYICDGLIAVARISALVLLAERFDGIGQWSKYQVLFMIGYGGVVRGLLDTFFGYNLLCISRRLGRGQLDHVLAQPQPLWLTFLTDGFMPFSGACNILPGLVLLVWSIQHLALPATPLWYLLLLINMAASGTIVLAFCYLWGSLAFWAPRAAEEISSLALTMIDELKNFTLGGLGSAALAGLMTFVPVAFVAWYPSQSLLGLSHSPWGSFITPAAALVFLVIAAGAFLKGMKHYGATGSQRYSNYGHRS